MTNETAFQTRFNQGHLSVFSLRQKTDERENTEGQILDVFNETLFFFWDYISARITFCTVNNSKKKNGENFLTVLA